MEPIQGISLPQFPLERLSKVAELIYFDGPLLSLFKSEHNDNYFYYWCDVDTNYNRWLVFRVGNDDLNLYITGQIPLKQLLLHPMGGFLYSIDIDNDIQYNNIYLLSPENLPEVYLPDDDSFYEFEPLFLENNVNKKQKGHKILIDQKWTLEDLAKFPGYYSQVYAFLYPLQKSLTQSQILEDLQLAYNSYPWRGGYSSVHFYRAMNNLIEPSDKPEIASMQYASPGWIELNLFVPIISSIQTNIIAFIKFKKELNQLYMSINNGLRTRLLIKIDAKSDNFQLNESDSQFIKDSILQLSELMKFEYLNQINKLTDNPLIVLKILLSFYRRVKNLAQYQIEGKVKFFS